MFSGILGAERCPRVQIPGLRSLSWGVWTCSSQPGNDNPAPQERLPQCGTACHSLTHSRPGDVVVVSVVLLIWTANRAWSSGGRSITLPVDGQWATMHA